MIASVPLYDTIGAFQHVPVVYSEVRLVPGAVDHKQIDLLIFGGESFTLVGNMAPPRPTIPGLLYSLCYLSGESFSKEVSGPKSSQSSSEVLSMTIASSGLDRWDGSIFHFLYLAREWRMEISGDETVRLGYQLTGLNSLSRTDDGLCRNTCMICKKM